MAGTYFDRVLNIFGSKYARILNMAELRMVLNMPQYGWICLNRTWICLNMSEFTIIYKILNMYHTTYSVGSLYKLLSTYWEIFRTLSEWFGKMIIVFNYFRKKLHLELLIDCRVLNMSELWIFVNFLKYDRVQNMRLDAIMKGLWIFLIYQISAYASVAQGSEYALLQLKKCPIVGFSICLVNVS